MRAPSWSLLFALCGCSSSTSAQSLVDAGEDASVPDALPADDAPTDAGACIPMNTARYAPRTFQYAEAGSTACAGFGGDGGLIQAYGDACFGHGATFAACAGFAFPQPDADPAAASCVQCLLTVETPDAAYGAVGLITVPMIDYPACIQATDPTDAGAACAQAVSQVALCAEYACKSACPVVDDSTQATYLNCWNEAWTSVCAGYGAAASACLAAERADGGTPTAQLCFPGPTDEANYLSIARLLCGG